METQRERLRRQLAEEHLAKQAEAQEINILQECLPYQLEFIKHPAKRKAVCGTRRAAKSYMFALMLIDAALRTPKGKMIYMGLTNDSCKQIMWTDIFETIFSKYQLPCKLTAKLEIEFDNGAIIFLRGLDATPHQMNRLRGQKFDLAVIDEVQDFSQDVRQIIQGVLKMSLAQTGATLCLGGTPGNQQGAHYWWQIWKDNSEETEWEHFHFNWKDNTSVEPKTGLRICDVIQQEVDADIARNPLIVHTPTFRQEVLGEWVIETSARIYRYEDANRIGSPTCPIARLPDAAFLATATYLLGADFGFNDATAFVIAAYNLRYSDKLYVLHTFSQSHLTVQQAAMELRRLDATYHFTHMVGDSSDLQLFKDIQLTYSIPIEQADRSHKFAHQTMLNSDFIMQNVVIAPHNTQLIEQLLTVIWDRKALLNGKHTEDTRYENHLTDSLLYLHNYSRHLWYKAPKPKPEPQDYFLQRILEGEKAYDKRRAIQSDRRKLNPYSNNPRYTI